MRTRFQASTVVISLVSFLFAGVLVGAGCRSANFSSEKLSPAESRLVGRWFSGNGMGTFTVSLQSNRKYTAHATQCMGPSGGGSGRWEMTNGFVVLHPRKQWGDLEHLEPRLAITNVNGNAYLLKTDWYATRSLSSQGPGRNSAFKKDSWW